MSEFISEISDEFIKHFDNLQNDKKLQRKIETKLELFEKDNTHKSLRFKKIKSDLWSMRVDPKGIYGSYRLLGKKSGNVIIWFWVGKHDEYERLIEQYR